MENQESEDLIVHQIENDEFYQTFIKPDSKAVLSHSLNITEKIKKLGDGIELISQELQRQVLANYNDLLQQANHAVKLENVLSTMNLHIQNLFANAERLKAQIAVPYEALESHTKVLERLHKASHILRQVNRVQQLSKRLLNTNDPVQKATVLSELEQLAMDPELKDIEVVSSELRNSRVQQQKVVNLATASLNQGIINENVTQTTTALQIFMNLGVLKSTLDKLVDQSIYECRSSLKLAFETSNSSKVKGGPGHITLKNSQGFRGKIWNELEKAFSEHIYQICKQIKFLQINLNSLYSQKDISIVTQFWQRLGEVIVDEIRNSESAIKQLLEEEYPHLLKCYYEMIKKLKYNHFQFSRDILKNFETSYLSVSLTRMLDPTQSMFTIENSVPTQDQIDSLVRVVSNELSVALIEDHLSELIAKNVSKCINMFSVKTEQQLETGPEAAQVIAGSPNAGQQKNTQYANSLYYLRLQIQRMLSNMKDNLPEHGVKLISDSLENLDNLVRAILQPLVVSVNSVIETIIVTIHLESDWNRLNLPSSKNVSCSPYMRELTQFISRVYSIYLAPFENKDVLSEKCKEITLRSIELFVRHSSLLRPISQGGRLRLQIDYQHLENALRIIYPQLPDLGQPYRLLKSMATLVGQSPAEIISSQVSGSSVPHSTVLLMLFSHAGQELASPHQNTGWSLTKLSAWLDEHPSEAERLDLVAGAVQKYEALVRQKNSTNYDPVYPIMSQLLESAVKDLH